MPVPLNLLELTNDRALGIMVYGGPGMRKTLGVASLPYPIRHYDVEGGDGPLLPWTRRTRRIDSSTWKVVPQTTRELAIKLLNPKAQKANAELRIPPAPLIDVIYVDPLEPAGYSKMVDDLTNSDFADYNSISIDPMQDFSRLVQSYSKQQKSHDINEPISGIWQGIQERTAIMLRRLRAQRLKGIFIYLTCSAQIDKDYVDNIMEKRPHGTPPPEPYSVKGTVNMPGKMTEEMQHLTDVMFHVEALNGSPAWYCTPKALPGGVAHWEAKDRLGRLGDLFYTGNMRIVLDQMYGEDIRKQIYASGQKYYKDAGVLGSITPEGSK